MFPDFASARLLVHIAFHYSPGRERYLERVLQGIRKYHFAGLRLVVDTNVEAAREITLPAAEGMDLHWRIHDQLKDPFELTWQHRLAMPASIDQFDYFMYMEDDMLVPFPALQRWRSDSVKLWPRGYLRAFLRTECNSAGDQVVTDQTEPARAGNYRLLSREAWYYPENPYHALWIYSREQLREFISSPAWIDGNNPEWGIRERAAGGMIWAHGEPHRCLLPLDSTRRVHPDAWIRHLPNNYALDPESEYGRLSLEQLHSGNPTGVLYAKLLGLLAKRSDAGDEATR
jgi:hypothetical protein